MTTISIPAHSVVMIIGGRNAAHAQVAAIIDAAATPWDVNKPDRSAEDLTAALVETGRARVVIANSHASARRTVAAIGRKHGAISICIRLPGADAVDMAAERIDVVHDVTDVDGLVFGIVPMPSDLRHLTGPFDIIGDVHGCADELMELLEMLGHASEGVLVRHPQGRVPILLGDLTDRGPQNLRAVRIAQELESLGGHVIVGNHDDKLARWLIGKKVRIAAGLAMTVAEMESLDASERQDMAAWLNGLQPHLVLDGGRLVVAHAGLAQEHHGRHTNGARAFSLYGKATGEIDEDGYPVAEDWAQTYEGEAVVVHGHVVHAEPRVVNGVYAIDTGCVFGGRLTALHYPERTFVSVAAHAVHFAPRSEPT